MIELRQIEKKYKEEVVLHSVTVKVEKGEMVFLRGASGSGKTTLLKLLNREIEEYDGDILLDGRLYRQHPKHIIRREVSTIFQSFELLERKTAIENVMLAGEVLGRPKKELKELALRRLAQVGLEDKQHRFPHELSGGEQQRIAIARALLNEPKVLLADEPTGNLDPQTAERIMELLFEINQKQGITMVIVTHSNELTARYSSNRILTMDKGVLSL
ncbi:hypothetical protein CN918_26660 [Priestia megaterium]|nr:hypothetical protein CN918_26660 [Priestia megaterium]